MPLHRFEVERSARRLDRLVGESTPELSRTQARALIDDGRVTVDGVVCRPSFKPLMGALIEVQLPEVRPSSLEPEDLNLDLLFEDEHLAVVFKPAGVVVHPSKGHATGTLVHGLLHALSALSGVGGEERPGIVHRLDKGTSGVMVVAKRDEAHRHLQGQFAEHSVERRYDALVLGAPNLDAGHVENQLGRAPRDRFRYTEVEDGGRRAETWWSVQERLHRTCLMECKLETGRTHQVRVHLSEMGLPILGDPLYKARKTPPPEVRGLIQGVDRQLLHARVLAFDHPATGERLRFERPPTEDMQRVLDGLRALGR